MAILFKYIRIAIAPPKKKRTIQQNCQIIRLAVLYFLSKKWEAHLLINAFNIHFNTFTQQKSVFNK